MLQVDAGKLLVQRDMYHVKLGPFKKLSCQPSLGDQSEDNLHDLYYLVHLLNSKDQGILLERGLDLTQRDHTVYKNCGF